MKRAAETVTRPQAKGHPESLEAGTDKERFFPRARGAGSGPGDVLASDFRPPELNGENNSYGQKTPSLRKLVSAAPGGEVKRARQHRKHWNNLSPGPLSGFD